MDTRRLGNSSLYVAPLSLGTSAISGDIQAWGAVDDNESIATIARAVDLGVTLIDTAPTPEAGYAEVLVGRALRGCRDRVLIASKCGLVPANENGKSRRCLAYDSILHECEESLRRLQTDRIDLYLCHWPDPDTPIRQTMEALTTLLRQGKILAIGLCNFGVQRIAAALEFGPVHCVQLSFSLLERRATTDLLPFCAAHGIGVLACGPLAKGLLTGKFRLDSRITGVRATDPNFAGSRYAKVLHVVAALRLIAETYEKTVAQLALNWTASHPGIAAAVFGAKRPSQVEEDIGAVGWKLEPADVRRMDALLLDL